MRFFSRAVRDLETGPILILIVPLWLAKILWTAGFAGRRGK